MNLNEFKDIYVFIEQTNGVIESVSYELLNEAQKLVKELEHFNYKVVAILLGHNISHLTSDVIMHGADSVIVCDHKLLQDYSTQFYTDVLCDISNSYHPDSLLIGATILGRDLAPRVAARLNTGLTADATMIEVDKENNSSLLLVTRPAFGGNLYGTIICPDHRPQMATIRPNVFEKMHKDETRIGTISHFEPIFKNTIPSVQIKEVIKKVSHDLDLTKAEIIISGGRGVNKHFQLLHDIAQQIGATVGASRAAVDDGYASKDIQVGQTGKTVKPRLYIACGISGAAQHIAGMEKSDYIIAINKDPNAHIFSIANLGIIGDAIEILPLLKDELSCII